MAALSVDPTGPGPSAAGVGATVRDGLLRRERLLRVLQGRHRVRLTVVEAPAGFGRTVLLDQALAAGPAGRGHRDLAVTVRAGEILASVLAAVADAERPLDAHRPPVPSSVTDLPDLAGRLDAAVASGGRVALVIDDGHRASDLLPTLDGLLAHLPSRWSVVVSARPGGLPSFARLVASGDASVVDAAALAFTPTEIRELGRATDWEVSDPDLATWPALAALSRRGRDRLIPAYLAEEVLAPLSTGAVEALAALAGSGGGGHGFLDAVLTEVGATAADRADVEALPLVAVDEEGVWPHRIWSDATDAVLAPSRRRRLVSLAVDDRLARHALVDGGRLACGAGDAPGLRRIVRRALDAQPPRVPLAALEAWAASGLVAADDVEHGWLHGVIAAQRSEATGTARALLERARQTAADRGDVTAETSLLLHLGTLARRDGDLAALQPLLARAEELGRGGDVRAAALVALGRALMAQLGGDPAGAVAVLDGAETEVLDGDWAAQVHMVRGTNLALCGRSAEARRSLTAAVGIGSVTSRAVAHDLLATTWWFGGDPEAALDHADRAVELARRAGSPAVTGPVAANRACLRALHGLEAEPLADEPATGGDAAALGELAAVIRLVQDGEIDAAADALRALPPPVRRPVRSAPWRAALEVALVPGARSSWLEAAATHRALDDAVRAGDAAAAHLAGGPPVERHQPLVPVAWCAPRHPVVHLRFLGGASLTVGGRRSPDPRWRRARVRELALHLAVRRDVGREAVAAALWPDLGATAAAANLRVTLTHLLDLVDPDRPRGGGSPLLVDDHGVMRFEVDAGEGRRRIAGGDPAAAVAHLRVDLCDRDALASRIIETRDLSSVLADADALLAVGAGPILGGASVGEWFEPVRRSLEDRLVRACAVAGRRALEAGEAELAERLADRMESVDPWSEDAHQVRIRARLALGDADGARRSVVAAWTQLAELGVTPTPALEALARRVGFHTPPWSGSPTPSPDPSTAPSTTPSPTPPTSG